jgi:hypothetical protein
MAKNRKRAISPAGQTGILPKLADLKDVNGGFPALIWVGLFML